MFIKATDSSENLSLTCEHISNRQNLSSFLLSPCGRQERQKEKAFEDNIGSSNEIYEHGVYPDDLSEKILSEVKFSERSSVLQNRRRTKEFYRL